MTMAEDLAIVLEQTTVSRQIRDEILICNASSATYYHLSGPAAVLWNEATSGGRAIDVVTRAAARLGIEFALFWPQAQLLLRDFGSEGLVKPLRGRTIS